MRLLPTVLCVALFATPAAAQSPNRQADEAAIRAVVRNYLEARERRDAPAIGALFTEDADQQTTGGQWRRGRAAIVPGTLASSQNNPGSRRITVETVRFLTSDVAIADGPYEIGAGDTNVRRMWATLVLVRQGNAWRIGAIRNMVPTAAATN